MTHPQGILPASSGTGGLQNSPASPNTSAPESFVVRNVQPTTQGVQVLWNALPNGVPFVAAHLDPSIVAMNCGHIFVRSDIDHIIRRVPLGVLSDLKARVADCQQLRNQGGLLQNGHALLNRINMETVLQVRRLPYDFPQHVQRSVLAKYRLQNQFSKMAYMFDQQVLVSLHPDIPVYQLPCSKLFSKTTYVLPQLNDISCVAATAAMLHLHGMSPDSAFQRIQHWVTNNQLALTQRTEIGKLFPRMGLKISDSHACTKGADAQQIASEIHEFCQEHQGPFALSLGGHVLVLDAIENTKEGYVLQVRDPFTGTVLEVNNHENVWNLMRYSDLQPEIKLSPTIKVYAVAVDQLSELCPSGVGQSPRLEPRGQFFDFSDAKQLPLF